MIELDNTLSERWFALSKDNPGKLWFYASLDRAPIYRALWLSPDDVGAVYAVAPFRLHREEDGRWLVLAAHPCPRVFEPVDEDWLGIETVIAWDPMKDAAFVLGDDQAQLVGGFNDEAALYASPRRFFQRWAQKRAAFAIHRQITAGKDWHSRPTETDAVPGALMIGKPETIRWRSFSMPREIEVVDADPRAINRAILRSANLPRAFQRAA